MCYSTGATFDFQIMAKIFLDSLVIWKGALEEMPKANFRCSTSNHRKVESIDALYHIEA